MVAFAVVQIVFGVAGVDDAAEGAAALLFLAGAALYAASVALTSDKSFQKAFSETVDGAIDKVKSMFTSDSAGGTQGCPYAQHSSMDSSGGPGVAMNESAEQNVDSSGGPATQDVPKYGDLPANPDELLDRGWKDTTPQGMAENTDSREFTNPETGEVVRWDKGKPGANGWEGKDHYHVENPGSTGKGDRYLDINGNPVPKGSNGSHIPPGGGS